MFAASSLTRLYYYDVNGELQLLRGRTERRRRGRSLRQLPAGPSRYVPQGSPQSENIRNTGLYLFAQDSWKIRPNLTLNYGLRWELNTPLTDKAGTSKLSAPDNRPRSTLADGANTDCTSQDAVGIGRSRRPRCSSGHDQTYYKAFAPRIGIAWSPGSSGKTSIRAGWGLFYNPIEQLVLAAVRRRASLWRQHDRFRDAVQSPFPQDSGR